MFQGEMDKDAWMAEMSKDADMRFQDRKVRRERADTLKTQAVKAYNRGEYEKALSCYNRAIDQVKDNPMLYCDRALTNIKLGNFQKVIIPLYKVSCRKILIPNKAKRIDLIGQCQSNMLIVIILLSMLHIVHVH